MKKLESIDKFMIAALILFTFMLFGSLSAQERGLEVEMYPPTHFQRRPKQGVWDLGKGRGEWGIGTTYSNHLGVEMFYHLFSAREQIYNVYFYDKCEEILGINRFKGSYKV